MTSGEQCVMMAGTALMQLWSVSSWDTLTLEVSADALLFDVNTPVCFQICVFDLQVGLHTAMLILVLVLVPSS